jgi:tRNA G10  N-methylase Trm11
MNYEAIQKSNQQIDYLQQHFSLEISNPDYLQHSNQNQNDQYVMDRQYRRNKSSYDRRDDHRRDEFRDKSNDRFQSNRRLKRCFVCDKSEC